MEKEEIIKLEIKAKELDEELSVLNERIFKERYHFAAKELTGKCFISKRSDEVYALKLTWVDTLWNKDYRMYGDRHYQLHSIAPRRRILQKCIRYP